MSKQHTPRTIICTIISFAVAGCSDHANETTASPPEATSTPEIAFENLTREGLTCDLQRTLLNFDEPARQRFGEIAQAELSANQRTEIVQNREKECTPSVQTPTTNAVGSTMQAITGTYSVVFIPETSGSGGYYPTYLTRDAAFYSWMCNGGSPESPADWILQYHVPGAYSNRSSLKIRGTDIFGSCYTSNPTASRVYSDDDIRTCVGYWTALLCGGAPTTYETVIWR